MRPLKEILPIEKRTKPKFTHTDGTIIKGEILDEVEVEHFSPLSHHIGKVYKYLVQKILYKHEILEGIKEELRICYYTKDFKKEKPVWRFGQYALKITELEFHELLIKTIKKGWILNDKFLIKMIKEDLILKKYRKYF